MIDETITIQKSSLKKILLFVLMLFVLLLGLIVITINILNAAPRFSGDPIVISIEPGTSIKTITENFASAGIAKSSTLLYFTIVLFFEPTEIKASTYYFDSPLTTYGVAKQLVSGDFDTDLVRFTHFEGERATSIATRATESLVNFDTERFLLLAVPMEGKLFPETYYIPPYFTADELFSLMTQTFDEALMPLQ
jgi:cell division protein YceG involved in septum cleavage